MFNGIWLVASESLMIRGEEVEAGERFEIPRIHAGPYLAKRQATIAPKIAPEPEPKPTPRRRRARKIQTAVITAESGYPEDSVSEALKRGAAELAEKRHYQRRDLEAEE